MKIIGITGSIASGKSTVAHLIAKKKYPLFSADRVVSELYKNNKFVKLLVKKFNLNDKKNIKRSIKLIVKKSREKLEILEKIIHPLVRKKMNVFLKINKKILILEIPLLVENKLTKCFDKVIFVDAKKKLRLKRYLKQNKDKETFEILNNRQLSPAIKKKFCDTVVNNDYSLAILKKNVKKFMRSYE